MFNLPSSIESVFLINTVCLLVRQRFCSDTMVLHFIPEDLFLSFTYLKFVMNHSLRRLPSVGVNCKDKRFRRKTSNQDKMKIVFSQVGNSIVIKNYKSTLTKQATQLLPATPLGVNCFLPRPKVGSL